MAADDVRFLVHDLFTREYRGELFPSRATADDFLRGNGNFGATLFVEDAKAATALKNLLRLDACVIYVTIDNVVFWGGILTSRTWDAQNRSVNISAEHFRAWFSTRLITPTVNSSGVLVPNGGLVYTNTEQTTLVRNLWTYAMNVPDAPYMEFSGPTTGKLRDTSNIEYDYSTVGDAIERIGYQENGFDWTVTFPVSNDLITPTLTVYYPERQSPVQYELLLSWDNKGGNIVKYDFPESVDDRISRMFTVGSEATVPGSTVSTGDAPDPQSVASASNLGTNAYVYREAKRKYSTVSTITTLYRHARTELEERDDLTSVVSAEVYLDNPIANRYGTGDRTRLRIVDDWVNIDLPAVRILERKLAYNANAPTTMRLTLDITNAYGSPVKVDN